MAWASTETSCKAICYDAVDGKAQITVVSVSQATSNGATPKKYHGWDVYWKRRFMAGQSGAPVNTSAAGNSCKVGDFGYESTDTFASNSDGSVPYGS